VLDEADPLEEHLSRPRLSRVSPATQASIGPVEDEWLHDNLDAIAESPDRVSFELAMRIVPLEWWAAQLPDRPSKRLKSTERGAVRRLALALDQFERGPCGSREIPSSS
jgi:hypothetical protein